jgi:hypothetical protein
MATMIPSDIEEFGTEGEKAFCKPKLGDAVTRRGGDEVTSQINTESRKLKAGRWVRGLAHNRK